MTPSFLIILILLAFLFLGATLITKAPVFGIATTVLFLFLAGNIYLTGIQEVSGRTIIENTTEENLTTVTETYEKENVTGLDTNFLGTLFILIAIFVAAGVYTMIKP